jgi:phage tail sheath protein FI
MVGIYNRTDADRGVHKAPANEVILGAINQELHLSRAEQDLLNPIGINCIRSFPGRGIRVWGGRTLSSDGAWRYVNVRRLFIMVEASLDAGMQWVVFEPNDHTLWAKVIRDTSSFLKTIWLGGALFGNTPEEAFYVKCDEELNPPEIRDLGRLIIEVGMAPVKPAEFVIFRITQWAGVNAEA